MEILPYCTNEYKLKVHSAVFARCPGMKQAACASTECINEIATRCDDQMKCKLTLDTLPMSCFPGKSKNYMEVWYTCESVPVGVPATLSANSPPPTSPNFSGSVPSSMAGPAVTRSSARWLASSTPSSATRNKHGGVIGGVVAAAVLVAVAVIVALVVLKRKKTNQKSPLPVNQGQHGMGGLTVAPAVQNARNPNTYMEIFDDTRENYTYITLPAERSQEEPSRGTELSLYGYSHPLDAHSVVADHMDIIDPSVHGSDAEKQTGTEQTESGQKPFYNVVSNKWPDDITVQENTTYESTDHYEQENDTKSQNDKNSTGVHVYPKDPDSVYTMVPQKWPDDLTVMENNVYDSVGQENTTSDVQH